MGVLKSALPSQCFVLMCTSALLMCVLACRLIGFLIGVGLYDACRGAGSSSDRRILLVTIKVCRARRL